MFSILWYLVIALFLIIGRPGGPLQPVRVEADRRHPLRRK